MHESGKDSAQEVGGGRREGSGGSLSLFHIVMMRIGTDVNKLGPLSPRSSSSLSSYIGVGRGEIKVGVSD